MSIFVLARLPSDLDRLRKDAIQTTETFYALVGRDTEPELIGRHHCVLFIHIVGQLQLHDARGHETMG